MWERKIHHNGEARRDYIGISPVQEGWIADATQLSGNSVVKSWSKGKIVTMPLTGNTRPLTEAFANFQITLLWSALRAERALQLTATASVSLHGRHPKLEIKRHHSPVQADVIIPLHEAMAK